MEWWGRVARLALLGLLGLVVFGSVLGDPAFADYRTFRELPKHVVREMVRFFQDYKVLEGKDVVVEEPLGVDAALRVLRDAIASYRARPAILK